MRFAWSHESAAASALQLGPGALLERTVMVEVRPIVQSPEETGERRGAEREDVARGHAVLVEEIGGVVDGVGCEHLALRLVGAQQIGDVQPRQLPREK